jgi:hypothetical protein
MAEELATAGSAPAKQLRDLVAHACCLHGRDATSRLSLRREFFETVGRSTDAVVAEEVAAAGVAPAVQLCDLASVRTLMASRDARATAATRGRDSSARDQGPPLTSGEAVCMRSMCCTLHVCLFVHLSDTGQMMHAAQTMPQSVWCAVLLLRGMLDSVAISLFRHAAHF